MYKPKPIIIQFLPNELRELLSWCGQKEQCGCGEPLPEPAKWALGRMQSAYIGNVQKTADANDKKTKGSQP